MINFSEIVRTGVVVVVVVLSVLRFCIWLKRSPPFKMVFLMLIAFLVLPFLTLLIPLFALHRQMITLILRAKYGSKFGGLLEGTDNAFVHKEASKCPVNGLYLIRYNKSFTCSFYEAIRTTIKKNCSDKLGRSTKMLSVIRKCLGYSYTLKNVVDIDDCILKLRKVGSSTQEIDKTTLMKLMSEYHDVALPNQDEGLWDVLIGTQPVKWKDSIQDDAPLYPVILRYKHVLGDGLNIMRMAYDVFSDNEDAYQNLQSYSVSNPKSKIIKPNNATVSILTTSIPKRIYEIIKFYLKQLYIICFCMAKFFELGLNFKEPEHLLHGPSLTKKKIVSFTVENSPHSLEVIRVIKMKVPGSTFIDILLTAVSSSLGDCYQRNLSEVPHTITVAVPEVSAVSGMRSANLDKGKYCRNLITFSLRKLPILTDTKEINSGLVNRLHLIMKGNYTKDPSVIEGNYQLLNFFFHYAPEQIVHFAMKLAHITAVVSNIPGPLPTTFLKGCPLQDVLPFPSHRERTGVAIGIYTYCGRLQLTLLTDSVLISEEKEVQAILNSTYKYLDLLSQEVHLVDKPNVK